MKTDKNINPQSTTRNEDTNQIKPTTTGSTPLNQETTRTPQTPQTPQKEEKENWKNPDPTSPEKRQEIYAGDKKDRTNKQQQDEDYDGEDVTDEDVDANPRAEVKSTDNRSKENDDIERGSNRKDQINP